jgi:hypothetical protein
LQSNATTDYHTSGTSERFAIIDNHVCSDGICGSFRPKFGVLAGSMYPSSTVSITVELFAMPLDFPCPIVGVAKLF